MSTEEVEATEETNNVMSEAQNENENENENDNENEAETQNDKEVDACDDPRFALNEEEVLYDIDKRLLHVCLDIERDFDAYEENYDWFLPSDYRLDIDAYYADMLRTIVVEKFDLAYLSVKELQDMCKAATHCSVTAHQDECSMLLKYKYVESAEAIKDVLEKIMPESRIIHGKLVFLPYLKKFGHLQTLGNPQSISVHGKDYKRSRERMMHGVLMTNIPESLTEEQIDYIFPGSTNRWINRHIDPGASVRCHFRYAFAQFESPEKVEEELSKYPAREMDVDGKTVRLSNMNNVREATLTGFPYGTRPAKIALSDVERRLVIKQIEPKLNVLERVVAEITKHMEEKHLTGRQKKDFAQRKRDQCKAISRIVLLLDEDKERREATEDREEIPLNDTFEEAVLIQNLESRARDIAGAGVYDRAAVVKQDLEEAAIKKDSEPAQEGGEESNAAAAEAEGGEGAGGEEDGSPDAKKPRKEKKRWNGGRGRAFIGVSNDNAGGGGGGGRSYDRRNRDGGDRRNRWGGGGGGGGGRNKDGRRDRKRSGRWDNYNEYYDDGSYYGGGGGGYNNYGGDGGYGGYQQNQQQDSAMVDLLKSELSKMNEKLEAVMNQKSDQSSSGNNMNSYQSSNRGPMGRGGGGGNMSGNNSNNQNMGVYPTNRSAMGGPMGGSFGGPPPPPPPTQSYYTTNYGNYQ